MKLVVACVLVFVAGAAFAQDLSSFEKILLPVDITGMVEGAGGSLFQTIFTVYSDRSFQYYPCMNLIRPGPLMICTYQPGQTSLSVPTFIANGKGRILYVSRDSADDLATGYILNTLAPQDACQRVAYTELPVARERDFKTKRLYLLEVPVGPGFRHTLRIYDVDSRGGQEFTVRIFLDRGRTLPDAEGTFATTPSIELTDPAFQSTFPPSAQISLQHAFDNLCFPRVEPCNAFRLARISVEATDPSTRFWAFVTATNNTNQHVTVITPW